MSVLSLNKRFRYVLAPLVFPTDFYAVIPLCSTLKMKSYSSCEQYLDEILSPNHNIPDPAVPFDDQYQEFIRRTSKAYYDYSQSSEYEVLNVDLRDSNAWYVGGRSFKFSSFNIQELLIFCHRVMNNNKCFMRKFIERFEVDLLFLDESQTRKVPFKNTILGTTLAKHKLQSGRDDYFSFNFFYPFKLLSTLPSPTTRKSNSSVSENVSQIEQSRSTTGRSRFERIISDDANSESFDEESKEDIERRETDQLLAQKAIEYHKTIDPYKYFWPMQNPYLGYFQDSGMRHFKERILWEMFLKFYNVKARQFMGEHTSISNRDLSLYAKSIFCEFDASAKRRIKGTTTTKNGDRMYAYSPVQNMDAHQAARNESAIPVKFATVDTLRMMFLTKNDAAILFDQLIKTTVLNSPKHIYTSFLSFHLKNPKPSIVGFNLMKPKVMIINRPAEIWESDTE